MQIQSGRKVPLNIFFRQARAGWTINGHSFAYGRYAANYDFIMRCLDSNPKRACRDKENTNAKRACRPKKDKNAIRDCFPKKDKDAKRACRQLAIEGQKCKKVFRNEVRSKIRINVMFYSIALVMLLARVFISVLGF
jgi:hypothetical protein